MLIASVLSILFFWLDKTDLALIFTFQVFISICAGSIFPLLWSMYADVADYATEKNGSSSTGLIFSSGTMAQKFGGAISGSLIALFLSLAGACMITDANSNQIIDPASVTNSVLTMIWSLFSLFPAFIALIMAYLSYKFPLEKDLKHANNKESK